jgi:uncharacterized protein
MPNEIVKLENSGVRGWLHRPAAGSGPGLVLTHGAGTNCAGPLLMATAEAFCSVGFLVLRYDLPFRQKRRFGPPHPITAAEDRAGVRAAIEAVRALASGPIFAGGHSYGGRQTSMLAAEDASVCDGLLLLSYPLHPPNKPAQLRTDHFPQLRAPALFVHGTKDPFGSIPQMEAAIGLIPSRTQLVAIDGAGHDLSRGRFDIGARMVGPLRALYSG